VTVLLKICYLLSLAIITVLAVRFLIVLSIDKLSKELNFGPKVRGQLLGYATSIPELTIVISSAFAGVFDAGFWNIASSNIINWILFLSAVSFFRQFKDLKRRTFVDEIVFGILSVIIPIILYYFKAQESVWLANILIIIFITYKVLDRSFNLPMGRTEPEVNQKRNSFFSIIILLFGIAIIVVSGKFLGGLSRELIVEFGISSWLIGWLLGFITSIPEMSGFFEVYRKHKIKGTIHGLDDTQEALDTLVSSNMCNLGIILPIGVFILFLI
jgi:Ca2+/Na+ antiporter